MLDRVSVVEENFITRIKSARLPTPQAGFLPLSVTEEQLLDWFDSQIKSRLLDFKARSLKERGQSFYTIGSSGHECNAVLGDIFSNTDMAFLHYRSGGFFIQRAKASQSVDGVVEILSSLVASSADNVSGGRHKVFGSSKLNIPPQTSTIASHLPKALGAAISITRAKELKINSRLRSDSVIYCSFGDASLNHAVSQTTFNACAWLSQSSYPIPLVLICEDNGLGISVPTPENWIKNSFKNRFGIHYIEADGLDALAVYQAGLKAEYLARVKKQVVLLHIKCVRLLGHAGSDIESQYLTYKQIEEQESRDPLLYMAHYLLHYGLVSSEEILSLYQKNKDRIDGVAKQCLEKPKHTSALSIARSLLPTMHRSSPPYLVSEEERQIIFEDKYKQLKLKRNLAQHINFALFDILSQYPETLVFGEDVGKKGGVYRVTADLQKHYGIRRVFDTLLDETTILGSAIGLAHNGFIPIAEIQFLAYLHNAEDQLRGEAATLPFFSNGDYANPMVIRVPGLAYQKGFGGHFHNDNSLAVLRDIPGLIVACPSNGQDAAKMLRTCVQLAYEHGRVVVFIEPIALYMTKDLHTPHDEAWLSVYPKPQESINLGEIGVYGAGKVVIISYGNGYFLSRQAEKILKDNHQTQVKVIDIRWLSPLPITALVQEIQGATHVLIVDECRRTGSLSEGLVTSFYENLRPLPYIKRLTGEDIFIPLGDAWTHVLPSRNDIVRAVINLVEMRN